VQSFVQVPVPEQVAVQSFLHLVRVQLPVPVQVMLQPLPGQESVVEPTAELFSVHLPFGQLKLQAPTPLQVKAQPGPAQVLLQAPTPEQTQGLPGLQAVPASATVVPTSGSSQRTTPVARHRARKPIRLLKRFVIFFNLRVELAPPRGGSSSR